MTAVIKSECQVYRPENSAGALVMVQVAFDAVVTLAKNARRSDGWARRRGVPASRVTPRKEQGNCYLGRGTPAALREND